MSSELQPSIWRELMAIHARDATHEKAPGRAAIVLAGGRGSRLRRLAEQLDGSPRPKQFCSFGGKRSLLDTTLTRMRRQAPPGRTLVVMQRDQLGLAHEELSRHPGVTAVVQPADCGTGLGVLLPLVMLAVRFPRATVLVSPCDHAFARLRPLDRALRGAFAAVEARRDRLVLIGASATTPEPEYGWIVPAPLHRPYAGRFEPRPVAAFVEKPTADEALTLHQQGALWSTMLLCGSVEALIGRFGRAYPKLLRALAFWAALPAAERPAFLDRLYERLTPLDLSRDLLPHAGDIDVVALPPQAGWVDLGNEARLLAHLARNRLRARRLPRPESLLATA